MASFGAAPLRQYFNISATKPRTESPLKNRAYWRTPVQKTKPKTCRARSSTLHQMARPSPWPTTPMKTVSSHRYAVSYTRLPRKLSFDVTGRPSPDPAANPGGYLESPRVHPHPPVRRREATRWPEAVRTILGRDSFWETFRKQIDCVIQ